jgi:hypothetical protein
LFEITTSVYAFTSFQICVEQLKTPEISTLLHFYKNINVIKNDLTKYYFCEARSMREIDEKCMRKFGWEI